jgi:tRNA-dihydrouridine synthase 2
MFHLIHFRTNFKKKKILTTLVNGCSKPITCKIRCLPTIEETIVLCKIIEKCGVAAIGVHGRFQHERSRNPNHDDFIAAVAKELTIPVIAKYQYIKRFRF